MGQMGASSLLHWPKVSPPNKGGDGDFCPPPSVHEPKRTLPLGTPLLQKMSLTTRDSSPLISPRACKYDSSQGLRACVAFAYTGTSPVEQPPREAGLIHLNPKSTQPLLAS